MAQDRRDFKENQCLVQFRRTREETSASRQDPKSEFASRFPLWDEWLFLDTDDIGRSKWNRKARSCGSRFL